MTFEVLFEDNHLLVVGKPSGMLAQSDVTGDASLVDLAKAYRKRNENKPGNVFIGLTHRLDRPTSGIIALAKTGKAAARLSAQFRTRSVEKRYLAVVELQTRFPAVGGEWDDQLVKDRQSNRVTVIASELTTGESARRALTRWRLLADRSGFRVVELHPLTGRSHQLRAQCAAHAMPIYGDRKYGSRCSFGGAIALHAYYLRLDHPIRREPLVVRCPLPESWLRFQLDPALVESCP